MCPISCAMLFINCSLSVDLLIAITLILSELFEKVKPWFHPMITFLAFALSRAVAPNASSHDDSSPRSFSLICQQKTKRHFPAMSTYPAFIFLMLRRGRSYHLFPRYRHAFSRTVGKESVEGYPVIPVLVV